MFYDHVHATRLPTGLVNLDTNLRRREFVNRLFLIRVATIYLGNNSAVQFCMLHTAHIP
jgi:hypothetical protein